MVSSRCNARFTLIEVVIMAAIAAILAAVARTNYSDYVRHAKFPAAFAALSDWRFRLQQFYQGHRSHGMPGTLIQELPCDRESGGNGVSPPLASDDFVFHCVLGGPDRGRDRAYRLTASGRKGVAAGYDFTLDSDSLRRTTLFAGRDVSSSCWLVKGNEC